MSSAEVAPSRVHFAEASDDHAAEAVGQTAAQTQPRISTAHCPAQVDAPASAQMHSKVASTVSTDSLMLETQAHGSMQPLSPGTQADPFANLSTYFADLCARTAAIENVAANVGGRRCREDDSSASV
nr:hypothetical protein HK105_004635 [Polyrhizophydium stewartii]